MTLAIALVVAAARGWVRPTSRDRQVAIVFTLIGLAGTLPMLVSPKQTGHYLMPAVPFYAIGAPALVAATVDTLARRLSKGRGVFAIRILTRAGALVGLAAILPSAVQTDPIRLSPVP